MIEINYCAKPLYFTGILCVSARSPDDKTSNQSENLPKVSGPPAQYSRFGETLSGDFFDRHCAVGVAGDFPSLLVFNTASSLDSLKFACECKADAPCSSKLLLLVIPTQRRAIYFR
jgi:hypothetical protein